MSEPVEFEGTNITLRAPSGQEDNVGALRAFTNGTTVVTCWELDEQDLAEITRTGKIYISVLSGRTIHPMYVGRARDVAALCEANGGSTFPVLGVAP